MRRNHVRAAQGPNSSAWRAAELRPRCRGIDSRVEHTQGSELLLQQSTCQRLMWLTFRNQCHNVVNILHPKMLPPSPPCWVNKMVASQSIWLSTPWLLWPRRPYTEVGNDLTCGGIWHNCAMEAKRIALGMVVRPRIRSSCETGSESPLREDHCLTPRGVRVIQQPTG